MKSTNLGNFRVLRHDIGIPHSSVTPRQGVACALRGTAEREAWISLGYAEAYQSYVMAKAYVVA